MDEAGARMDVPDKWDASLIKIDQDRPDVPQNAMTLRFFRAALYRLARSSRLSVSDDPGSP